MTLVEALVNSARFCLHTRTTCMHIQSHTSARSQVLSLFINRFMYTLRQSDLWIRLQCVWILDMHTGTYSTVHTHTPRHSKSCSDFHSSVYLQQHRPPPYTDSEPATAGGAKSLAGGGDLIFIISRRLQQAISQELEKALCQVALSTNSATALFGGAQVWRDQTH